MDDTRSVRCVSWTWDHPVYLSTCLLIPYSSRCPTNPVDVPDEDRHPSSREGSERPPSLHSRLCPSRSVRPHTFPKTPHKFVFLDGHVWDVVLFGVISLTLGTNLSLHLLERVLIRINFLRSDLHPSGQSSDTPLGPFSITYRHQLLTSCRHLYLFSST